MPNASRWDFFQEDDDEDWLPGHFGRPRRPGWKRDRLIHHLRNEALEDQEQQDVVRQQELATQEVLQRRAEKKQAAQADDSGPRRGHDEGAAEEPRFGGLAREGGGGPASPARASGPTRPATTSGYGRQNVRAASPGITALRERVDARRVALGKAPKYPGGVPGGSAGGSGGVDALDRAFSPPAPDPGRRVGGDVLGSGQQYGGGTPKATTTPVSTTAPQDQAALASKYGAAAGVDPNLLLAIAKHETDFGRLGLGRKGLTLGVGAFDSGPTMQWQGPENQYRKGAELLQKWGVKSIDDVLSGKASKWATDPKWESAVANAYKGVTSGAVKPPAGGAPTTAPSPSGAPSAPGSFLTGPQQSQLKPMVEAAKTNPGALESLKQQYPNAAGWIDAIAKGEGAEFVPTEKWREQVPAATAEAWDYWNGGREAVAMSEDEWAADPENEGVERPKTMRQVMQEIEKQYGPAAAAAVRARAYLDYPLTRGR